MQTQNQILFGSGAVTFIPISGDLGSNPTPTRLKVLQDAQIDFKGELKKLYGQLQVPVASARGKVDISGKAKCAAPNLSDIAGIYFGANVTAGSIFPVDEIHAVATSVTPTVGSGDNIFTDYGVINQATGLSMVRVASSPAVGQYSFTAATTGGSPTAAEYAFNVSETATSVLISFLVTAASAGATMALAAQAMGWAPVCSMGLFNSFRNAQEFWQFNSVTLGQFSRPTKQDDFWVSDFDFSVNADAAGNIGYACAL
jgi:hypothetical protein